ncbi:molecular chaperone [Pantoea sp. DY-15]|uniref:fimbrial biogenesis chaperone n=1 Tax=unclassified Pantoea TaxID=2630326 RepID=UPI001C9639AE|nr:MULTISPECIES: molecular chaperone [unclassified Pantoea]MBY4839049.1 molecular chaperone [Pantoea sp. DY-5]MBY4889452.1 molecular chaperone [Pantoea sp. DY-15]
MSKKALWPLALALLCLSPMALAGVQIGGTRLVYDGKNKLATISVTNPDDRPYLIQSWVSNQEESDNADDTFITTPPLFRLEPNSQNSVRVVYSGNSLATDQESVYWLNIKIIPTANRQASNDLVITIKNKMKLFYRPAELTGDPALAFTQLKFRQRDGKLAVFNPTPYSVSLYDLTVNGSNMTKPPMVLPSQEVVLGQKVQVGSQVTWRAINDFGGITAEQKLKVVTD